MEERILIVNADGLFSALPSLQEYKDNNFVVTNKVVGKVQVQVSDIATIFDNKDHIRVLLPELPPPVQGEDLLYISVVKGCLIRV